MSQFFEDLWESIFTPGPTPTLLLATNVTFAVLQLVLLVLLLATYSIHFIILSVLSGGLWWSVNWFARELKAVQLREEAEAEAKKKKLREAGRGDEDDADEEKEEEEDEENDAEEKDKARHSRTTARRMTTPLTTDSETEGEVAGATAISRGAEAVERRGELKQRKTAGATGAAGAVEAAERKAVAAAAAPAVAAPAPVAPVSPVSPASPAPPTSAPAAPDSPPSLLGARSADGGSQRLSGSRSGVSTEDEWEKVSENDNDNEQ